uniref:Uncharacterized protein n=1 Tax=Proboscia inermis TaxID=420281 RepID=A0A7S0GG48_9STRA
MEKCNAHPLFRKCTEEEMANDPCVELMKISTEEGKKVDREGRNKYWAVYQRLSDAEVLEKERAAEGRDSVSDFFREGQFGVNSVEAVVPIKGIVIAASRECDEKKI